MVSWVSLSLSCAEQSEMIVIDHETFTLDDRLPCGTNVQIWIDPVNADVQRLLQACMLCIAGSLLGIQACLQLHRLLLFNVACPQLSRRDIQVHGSVFIDEIPMCIILAQSILWLPCSLPAGFDHSCRASAKTSQLEAVYPFSLQVPLADQRVFPLYQELHLAALFMRKAFPGPHML